MSSGKAVITTSAGGSSEYVLNGECGLVVAPRDAAGLAKAIVELLKDSEKRVRMGEAGRTRSLNNYKRTTIAQQTLPIYQLAIDHFKAKPPSPLYRKSPESLLADANVLLGSFDTMLYNFLYTQSMDFRLKHRLKRIRQSSKSLFLKE